MPQFRGLTEVRLGSAGQCSGTRGHSKSKSVTLPSQSPHPCDQLAASQHPPTSWSLAQMPDPNQRHNKNCASNCPTGDHGLA